MERLPKKYQNFICTTERGQGFDGCDPGLRGWSAPGAQSDLVLWQSLLQEVAGKDKQQAHASFPFHEGAQDQAVDNHGRLYLSWRGQHT